MIDSIRVFVNASAVEVSAGAVVSEAVRSLDPALGQQVASGAAYVTDGRGIEVPASLPLVSGAILRVIVRARRRESTDADA